MWRWILLGAALGLLLLLWFATSAGTYIPCKFFERCVYEAPAFRFTVVDAETEQPLDDVHALAEWRVHSSHGSGEVVLVQDAVSGPDGVVTFPAWGPLTSVGHLERSHDPVITLFKSGYATLPLWNEHAAVGAGETTRQRSVVHDGQSIRMQPFRGTPPFWLHQLQKAGWGYLPPRSDRQTLQFRDPYLNRMRRIWAERDKLPPFYQELKIGSLFWLVEREMRHLEGGGR